MNIQNLASTYKNFINSKHPLQHNLAENDFFLAGLSAEKEKKYDEALVQFNKCLPIFEADALLGLKIASIFEKRNNKEQAKKINIQTIKNNLATNYDALSAYNIHPSIFLERHLIAEFILKNKVEIKKRIEERLIIQKTNQNKVFVYWDNPEKAPEIVKVALKSQKKYVKNGMELTIITKDNLLDYVSIPDYIEPLIQNNPAHFSDWLRTELLSKYGGVWLDATCLLSQDLNSSLGSIKEQDCFFFTYTGSRVGSWFIYSTPNSYILNTILVVLNLWWEKENYLTNYFMYHDIVEMLYWTDENYKKEWDAMFKIHPMKALLLNQNLSKNFDKNLYEKITSEYFLHKLTYKFDQSLYQANSFVKHLASFPKIKFTSKNDLASIKNGKKVWMFSSYVWQGNPKALFLYMNKNFKDSYDCWWISENNNEYERLKKLGIQNILLFSDTQCKALFANCDAYITENFREKYPENLPLTTKIINTWHGVGLKHIELALGEQSVLADSVVRKYIRNFKLYRNQSFFLATSQAMEDHFIEDTVIDRSHIIRGPYPRNTVYDQLQTYDIHKIIDKSQYRNVILFAPTYRITKINGVLNELLPNFDLLQSTLEKNDDLLIIKVHPFMKKDSYFIEMQKKYEKSENILFWNDTYDIYEVFQLIDIAIVDYSSIFYDLLEANVKKFIRYIPDFNEYSQSLELIGDYFSLTDGVICESFTDLLNTISLNLPEIKNKETLLEYFFSYAKNKKLDQLIEEINKLKVFPIQYKELHSFDIFDTLICRSTLAPFSIFSFMQQQLTKSELDFPQSFKDNWVQIRHQVEIDVRDMFKKTLFERKSDQLEICLDLIYERLQNNYLLSHQQINYLKKLEIDTEISHVEPIESRIDYLFEQQRLGHDVILISDMYLPELVIRNMLAQADSRLLDIPLYLSSAIGHQKSTGKLFKHIFFQKKYQYEKWVHYGDNGHADGTMPLKLGIEAHVHHMDSFIPFEKKLVDSASTTYKYEAYQLATSMQRYRQNILNNDVSISSEDFEKKYYAYAYAGSLFVPYVHWTILDALARGYETLYFISRDGHYLKLIADEIIRKKNYNIKSKFIYGSRKVWRLPSYIHNIDDEMFGPFGNFVGMDSFDDLVRASYLSEEELLTLFPEFESLKSARHLRGEIAENIRKTLSQSEQYRNKILGIAAEKRGLVRQYLQENIDFSEKFAFVEFWGRGYTQDTFTRLLSDAAKTDVINPFYYIRSFTPETSQNLRHNFVLAPVNFSFFEPLFASTPYDSISEYQKIQSHIEAIVIPRHNDYSRFFEQGLIDFVKDYIKIEIKQPISFANMLNEHSYTYQIKEFNDQFICNVFGKLKDNISSFGETKEYAPVLSIKQLETIRDKKDLDKLTSSISISLSRSNDGVRAYYQKIYKKMKLPAVNSTGIQYFYPENPLENYIRSSEFPMQVVATQSNAIYLDIGFKKDSKREDIILNKGDIFNVIAIEWLKNGIPRLVTRYGYVTAHRNWVLPLNEAKDVYIRKNENGEYEPIKQLKKPGNSSEMMTQTIKQDKELSNQKPVSEIIRLLLKSNKMLNDKESFENLERKLGKFTRDPHQFFADAKNDKIVWLKYCFDENHKVGKTFSNWIRRNL